MSFTDPLFPAPLLTADVIQAMPEARKAHRINKGAVRMSRSLGDATGLERLGAHLVRVEPGMETTEFHFHENEEELIYVLSGEGIAEIGDESRRVAAGDFMGFTLGGPAHSLRNDSDRDLVYLLVGERREDDVVIYPRAHKRLVVLNGQERLEELPPTADP